MKETAPFPFRWVLPATQLALCAVLLWSWRYALIFQFYSAAHAYWPAAVQKQALNIPFPLLTQTAIDRAAFRIAELRLITPSLLNLPCLFFGLGIRTLVPNGMMSDFWHSISWPLFGVIFWWIAGRGIEAVAAARSGAISPKISWVETFVALWIVTVAGVLVTGIIVDPEMRADFIFPWRLGLAACFLWIALGSTTILARFVQWRIRRHMRVKAEGHTAPA
jgi:CDP-diglyceride synthetase